MTSRVLLITPHFAPQQGGVPRLVTAIVDSSCARTQWRVITTAAGSPAACMSDAELPTAIRAGVDVRRVAGTAAMVASAAASIAWLRNSHGRVVCGHPYLAPIAVMIARAARVPVVGLGYGRELVATRATHAVALAWMRRMDRVVTISTRSADAVRLLGLSSDRIDVVHPVFTPPWATCDPARREYASAGLRLVMISRLAEGYKNFEVAIRAAGVLGRAGIVDSLTIVGDGPRRDALESFARRVSGPYVRFAGALHDQQLAELLTTADVGVFPSRESSAEGGFEGFGLVVHEMGASGLPVVVGSAAGALDAFRREFCVSVPADDLLAWVNTITVLAQQPRQRRAMAMQGYSWGQAIDQAATARSYVERIAA